MRRAGITLAALTTLTTLAVPAASSALASSQPASAKSASAKPTTAKPAAPEIRLNQVGYQPTAPKSAYVMLPARVASVPFTITDAKGRVVYRGVSRDDVGADGLITPPEARDRIVASVTTLATAASCVDGPASV